MKKRKKLIGLIIALLVIFSLLFLFIFLRNKKDELSLQQRQWIENNKSYVIDVSILSDIPALTYDGQGIVFDFLNYLGEKTGLTFKPVVISNSIKVENNYSFNITDKLNKNDILIDTDNYVLINKNNLTYNDTSKIINQKIGVLETDIDKFKNIFDISNQLVSFKSKEEMISSKDIDSFIILKSNSVNYLIEKSAKIGYEFGIKKYYTLKLNGDETLNSIIKKYYNNWKDNYYISYNSALLNNYYGIAKISNQEQAELKNNEYIYGFVNNGIFDSLKSNKLYGINKIVMKSFSEFSGVPIQYKKYHNIKQLTDDFNNGKINIMINNSTERKIDSINTNAYHIDLFVISNIGNDISINEISDLSDQNVYTIKNSLIENILKKNNIKVNSCDDFKSFTRKINKNSVFVIEKENFDYYKTRIFKNYKINYIINSFAYGYKVNSKNNQLFEKLFNFYISYVDIDRLIDHNYSSISYKTIDYSLILIILIIVIVLSLVARIINKIKKFVKKIIASRKKTLSKAEKLKYIDQLTSLKNRAYLNTKVEQWDDSESYPQSVIIIDLNNIAFINDNYGREEGDKIIRDAANILIQFQLPNTEIIRTDGNEFLIYLVGYSEKEIISYLRKLSKVLKKLDHGFGAATGYSMILDAIKTFDDAVNEATIEMKQSKEDSLKK